MQTLSFTFLLMMMQMASHNPAAAKAAEELMPMIGASASANPGAMMRTRVILPEARTESRRAPVGRRAESERRAPAELRFATETDYADYIRWKNTLQQKPIMVAGGTLELDPPNAYASAQPYVLLPEPTDGIIVSLGKDLIHR